jgi:hypothetical protein
MQIPNQHHKENKKMNNMPYNNAPYTPGNNVSYTPGNNVSYAPTPRKRLDLSDAAPQQDFHDLIPSGTIAKVRMTIKPGGYDDPARGWTDGYPTCKWSTGAIYLNCKFSILEGEYAGRDVWSLIGLHSVNGDKWKELGRSFMKAILNSARGFAANDKSLEAIDAQQMDSFAELDGIVFIARIGVEKDKETKQDKKNVINIAIPKGHKDYDGGSAQPSTFPPSSAAPWER